MTLLLLLTLILIFSIIIIIIIIIVIIFVIFALVLRFLYLIYHLHQQRKHPYQNPIPEDFLPLSLLLAVIEIIPFLTSIFILFIMA